MALSLDIITLGASQVDDTYAFYAAAFSPTPSDCDQKAGLDLHGTGRLAVRESDALAAAVDAAPHGSGFRGVVLSCIVTQPSDVEALLELAVTHGATVVKPAKKQLFGEFTAVYQAPGGAVWKLAAATKKNKEAVRETPKPAETAVYLGVDSPKTSKAFYAALGMTADRDYGDTFVDFSIDSGVCRLGLLTRKALAKDAGIDEAGDGFSDVLLTHVAESRAEVDSIVSAADAAGARLIGAAGETETSEYAGYFTDPDGHHWKVAAA